MVVLKIKMFSLMIVIMVASFITISQASFFFPKLHNHKTIIPKSVQRLLQEIQELELSIPQSQVNGLYVDKASKADIVSSSNTWTNELEKQLKLKVKQEEEEEAQVDNKQRNESSQDGEQQQSAVVSSSSSSNEKNNNNNENNNLMATFMDRLRTKRFIR